MCIAASEFLAASDGENMDDHTWPRRVSNWGTETVDRFEPGRAPSTL